MNLHFFILFCYLCLTSSPEAVVGCGARLELLHKTESLKLKYPPLSTERLLQLRAMEEYLSWSLERRQVIRNELLRRVELDLIPVAPASLIMGLIDDMRPEENLFRTIAPDITAITQDAIFLEDVFNMLFPMSPIKREVRSTLQSADSAKLMDKIVGRNDIGARDDLMSMLPTQDESLSLVAHGDAELAETLSDTDGVLTALLDRKMLEWHDELHGYTSFVTEEAFEREVAYCFLPMEKQRRGLTYVCSLIQLEATLDILRQEIQDPEWVSGPILYSNTTEVRRGRQGRVLITGAVALAGYAFYGVMTLVGVSSVAIAAASLAIQKDQHRLYTSTTPRTTTPRMFTVRPILSDSDFKFMTKAYAKTIRYLPPPDFTSASQADIEAYRIVELIWLHAMVAEMLKTHKQCITNQRPAGSFVVPLKGFVQHEYLYKLLVYMHYETSLAVTKGNSWIYLINYQAPQINDHSEVLYGWIGHPSPGYNITYSDQIGTKRFDYDLTTKIPPWMFGNGRTKKGYVDTRYAEILRMAKTTMPNSTTDPYSKPDFTAMQAQINDMESWQHWRNTLYESTKVCDNSNCNEFEMSQYMVRENLKYVEGDVKKPVKLTQEAVDKLAKRLVPKPK